MLISADHHREFGNTGLRVPPIAFGTGALGNVPRAMPDQRKLAICGEWFRHVAPPVFIETAQEYGGGRPLEMLGRVFQRLDVAPEEVVVSSKLGRNESRISYGETLASWDEVCRLLGGTHRPRLVSLDARDEHVAAAPTPGERGRRFRDILDAIRALDELKSGGQVAGIGVVAKDWRLIREIDSAAHLDWVTLAGNFTVMQHPPELLEFMANLSARRIAIVGASIFHCDFLVGGSRFDGRAVSAENPSDRSLFAWRKAFVALCHGHGVKPAHACIQFALSAPGVVAVAINTSRPDRIVENAKSAVAEIPVALWSSMQAEGLLSTEFPRMS